MIPNLGPDSSNDDSVGAVYLAFGAPYLAMAMVSAVSLRATNPAVPIHMITNVTDETPLVPWWREDLGDRWTFIDAGTATNRSYKTDMLRMSGFQKTVFLDCDTFVVGDLSRFWPLLDYFDLLLRPVPRPGYSHIKILSDTIRFCDVTHFNSGVFGFRRSSAVAQFFDVWKDRFEASGLDVDQPALLEALFTSSARVFPLRSEFNEEEVWNLTRGERERVVVWHYKRRRADRRIRRLLRSAVTWFGGTDEHRVEVEETLRGRAGVDGGPIRSKLRGLRDEWRGPLSRRLPRAVGEERWRRMTEPVA